MVLSPAASPETCVHPTTCSGPGKSDRNIAAIWLGAGAFRPHSGASIPDTLQSPVPDERARLDQAGHARTADPVGRLQAVPLSVGFRHVEKAAAGPLDARRGAAGRGHEGLGGQPDPVRAQSADPDLPLLHPGRHRGPGQLHGKIRSGVQTDRGQDDAGVLRQHGDHPHRGLRPAARDHRHARKRVRRLHGIRGHARQA